jgi:C4-dicarboxylate-specific signal transduction histidine kinase
MHKHDEKTGLAGHKHSQDPAKRKEELLREGEFYRAGVAHAKASIQHGIKPEVMMRTAFDHTTMALRARADALLKPTGTNVSMLMPYAMQVVNFVRQRRIGKQAAGAAVAVGALGWYLNRKRARRSAEQA